MIRISLKASKLLSAGDPRDCEDRAGHVPDQRVHQLQVDPGYLITYSQMLTKTTLQVRGEEQLEQPRRDHH